jgi:hypothetical protein
LIEPFRGIIDVQKGFTELLTKFDELRFGKEMKRERRKAVLWLFLPLLVYIDSEEWE